MLLIICIYLKGKKLAFFHLPEFFWFHSEISEQQEPNFYPNQIQNSIWGGKVMLLHCKTHIL